jgi:hypothetical protein
LLKVEAKEMSKNTDSQPNTASDVPEQLNPPNVFTGEERKALINEIVTEMKKDSIKEDALKELKKTNWFDLIAKFFQHPATLLIIGFTLTGLIGSRLTANWQREEWDRQKTKEGEEWNRQQQRLIVIHSIDLKYGIIDEIIKAVGERNAAARNILLPLLDVLDNRQLTQAEVEPINDWKKANHDWLVNALTLRLKLSAHIKNQVVITYFDQIVDKEKIIGAKVIVLQSNLVNYSHSEKNEKAQTYLQGLIDDIKATEGNLKRLVDSIATEALTDVQGNKP